MPEGELPERPGGELTPSQTKQPEQGEQGRSHEQLVQSFRDLIKQQAQVYAELRSPYEREVLPAEAIIRNQLDWYSAPETGGEEAFILRSAWDALAYDRYEVGSKEEHLAGAALQMYYKALSQISILGAKSEN